MADAPERIWAGDFDMGIGHCTVGMGGLYEEYVRADIVASQLAEARADVVTAIETANKIHNAVIVVLKDQLATSERLREGSEADNARLREALTNARAYTAAHANSPLGTCADRNTLDDIDAALAGKE